MHTISSWFGRCSVPETPQLSRVPAIESQESITGVALAAVRALDSDSDEEQTPLSSRMVERREPENSQTANAANADGWITVLKTEEITRQIEEEKRVEPEFGEGGSAMLHLLVASATFPLQKAQDSIRGLVNTLEARNLTRQWSRLSSQVEFLEECIEKLNPEEKCEIIGDLVRAHTKVQKLKEKHPDIELLGNLEGRLDVLCDGHAIEFAPLYTVLEAEKGMKIDQKKTLGIKDDKVVWIDPREATEASQDAIYKLLSECELALGNEDIIAQMPKADLIRLKIVLIKQMATCTSDSIQGNRPLALIGGQFEICASMLATIEKTLTSMQTDDLRVLYTPFKTVFAQLKSYIQTHVYFKEFWTKPTYSEQIEEHLNFINLYLDLLQDAVETHVPGLIFLIRNDELKLRIFQVESAPNKFIVISDEKDTKFNYLQFTKDRANGIRFSGTAHAPVKSYAEECFKFLKEFLEEESSRLEGSSLTLMGFGLDGSVMQLSGYGLAQQFPQLHFRSFGVGAPEYLSLEAARAVQRQTNLSSVNLVLKGDTQLKASWMSRMALGDYAESFTSYNLHTRDFFITDVTGHAPSLYRTKLEGSMKQIKEMYEAYGEITKIVSRQTR